MRSISSPLLFVILALVCVQQASGLFFYLKEGQKKCFLEDLPKDTVVVSSVTFSDIPENANIPGSANEFTRRKNADTEPLSLNVEVHHGKTLVSDVNLENGRGRFAFTSQEPGDHTICFKTNSSRWFGAGAIKIDLELDIGDASTNDYEEIKALESLSELEVQVRRLNDRVVDIRKEQAYFKYREETLRDESEMANANVMWFSFIQTFVLLASAAWQIYHLKSFFKAKKMV